MSDYFVKALAFDGQIRAFAVDATQTVKEAQKRHDTWHTSTAALGRTMIGALLLGYNLKGEEKLTVEVKGDGPAGKIVVDSNGSGQVRGYIQNPNLSLPLNVYGKLDVRGAVGTQGTLTVRKDLGLKEPFSGQVPIIDGELGEDFTYYMALSEQTPSCVGVSVLVDTDDSVKTAGGFMIQVMPGATDDVITEIENRIQKMPQISDLMDSGCKPEELLEWVLGKEHVNILETLPVAFHCDCTREKFEAGLLTLGLEDLKEIKEQDKGAEIVCHYCNDKYYFSEEDLQELIQSIETKA
ncbi:Hsp33 family molecular chaperone HslO [Granulicatella sp. zg-ZJ]|uniref:Hsp33 family molecular chaperone HslO n=1 Tax=unclassified Granulicatella TaxID=2630493 RepID=UPI0013C1B07C|nr:MULTISPECIES: Hsp33 family molecular chaperone HslO [unclassified Granulicatella]MBS4750191.1 Hsp33 family molecular chaperone HslO [Carnobacteriaceae bacterium zg-ZUI78]NEW63312.1 Hsp33 family molecular chaperone HslO [Granulicatella sp. zg-ZJ]NEW66265.1 Hsp33 family molecular chaperone HslO [Granulicatella sp. zg-84]QMI85646.1 Hsp33 family molecular chaperone HslO [Carnobacteriaceae bacterium zg-84]